MRQQTAQINTLQTFSQFVPKYCRNNCIVEKLSFSPPISIQITRINQLNSPQLSACTYISELMISFDANSKNSDEFASCIACLLALLNEAAVPCGDFGSIPPREFQTSYSILLRCINSCVALERASINISSDTSTMWSISSQAVNWGNGCWSQGIGAFLYNDSMRIL